MKSRLSLFLISYVLWLALVWVYRRIPPGWDFQSMLLGIGASAAVAAVFGHNFTDAPGKFLNPIRWFYTLIFIPVFAVLCIKANLQVSSLVLNPKMPIKPGIIKIRTTLKTRTAITMMANCITLTPGTLTVEATDAGVLYVHWISIQTIDEEQASRKIAGQFEWYLSKIFED